MWKPPINFLTLHYAWIIFAGLLALLIIYPNGNMPAIDAWFFGASASTESGLNTIDVKDLKTYQQVYIYIIPIITNLGFINVIVVAVRLMWFEKRFKTAAAALPRHNETEDVEAHGAAKKHVDDDDEDETEPPKVKGPIEVTTPAGTRITFDKDARDARADSTLYIPTPQARDDGHAFVEKNTIAERDEDDADAIKPAAPEGVTHRRGFRASIDGGPSMSRHKSIEKAAASLFILGKTNTPSPSPKRSISSSRWADLPYLSKQATVGRNSSFHKLTVEDRERLGGIEYRALRLLLKIVSGYFFGLHLFGAICLLPWIHNAPAKYTDWLAELGQGKTWWAFYTAQTMVNNLGFTLTTDSMITFRDATWPMLVTTFLAYAGETFYPCFLRLIIWIMHKVVPKTSSMSETLQFLLDHPRRCYMLLFPSKPTWILAGILFAMNFVDILLIIVLDLDNPAVSDLPMGPRILAALFQAASARHTGTASFNLAAVNPAVQFSLLVMMYVAIFPIAISIRASNTYEERALGVYEHEVVPDETSGKSYVMMHIRNQLSFDLWYIFLGTFCICIAESVRIADVNEPSFSVFTVLFEVVSAYANVGLSLGHPSVMTSLSGQFKTISKVVVCAMMIRGRHRGLPYAMDRAIVLPGDREDQQESGSADDDEKTKARRLDEKLQGFKLEEAKSV